MSHRTDDIRIRAVLFDLDGTLYAQLPVRLAIACEMALVCGGSVLRGGARVPRIISTFRDLREQLRHQPPPTEGLPRRQYSVVADHLRCSREEVERVVTEWMHQRPLKWLSYSRRAGVIELLQFLEARRIRKGMFSDYPAQEKLTALGLGGQFDLVLSAEDPDIGVLKPDPRGFLAAAARWGLAPANVLYVGDRLEVDAVGALAAGMRCAVLTGERCTDNGVLAIRDFRELERVIEQLC